MMQYPKQFAGVFDSALEDEAFRKRVALRQFLSYYAEIFYLGDQCFLGHFCLIGRDLVEPARTQLCEVVRSSPVKEQVLDFVKRNDYPPFFTQVLDACLKE
jgi:hypothetical protein